MAVIVVQSLRRARLLTAARQTPPSACLLEFAPIHVGCAMMSIIPDRNLCIFKNVTRGRSFFPLGPFSLLGLLYPEEPHPYFRWGTGQTPLGLRKCQALALLPFKLPS